METSSSPFDFPSSPEHGAPFINIHIMMGSTSSELFLSVSPRMPVGELVSMLTTQLRKTNGFVKLIFGMSELGHGTLKSAGVRDGSRLLLIETFTNTTPELTNTSSERPELQFEVSNYYPQRQSGNPVITRWLPCTHVTIEQRGSEQISLCLYYDFPNEGPSEAECKLIKPLRLSICRLTPNIYQLNLRNSNHLQYKAVRVSDPTAFENWLRTHTTVIIPKCH